MHVLARTVGKHCTSGTRRLSTTAKRNSPLSPDHSIYVSTSGNPYFNLTLEDWLFRHKNPKEPLLLLYRDTPCVVIGRNQNPWKEVNLEASRRTGIPWIRRRSGGGTVYHDLGNTNFSVHLPRASFDRHVTAQLILGAVRSLDIDANVNDRNDICVGKHKICLSPSIAQPRLIVQMALYVSGSAYKIVNNRAYHHGTMLISTRLDLLGDLLHTNKDGMETKGVASVRSPVCNLQQFGRAFGHETFVDAVVQAFRREYCIDEDVQMVVEDDETKGIEYIRNGMAELPSWEWAYGQTPEFTYDISQSWEWGNTVANIRSKHGIILSCSIKHEPGNGSSSELSASLDRIAKSLEGQKYGFLTENIGIGREDERVGHVWQWLKTKINS